MNRHKKYKDNISNVGTYMNFTCVSCRSMAVIVTKPVMTYQAKQPLHLQCENCMTEFTVIVHGKEHVHHMHDFLGTTDPGTASTLNTGTQRQERALKIAQAFLDSEQTYMKMRDTVYVGAPCSAVTALNRVFNMYGLPCKARQRQGHVILVRT